MIRKYILVYILFWGIAAHGQVDGNDTSAAIMQIIAQDSANLKKEIELAATRSGKLSKDRLSALYSQISQQYENHGLNVPALRYALQAVRLAEASGSKGRLAQCYVYLGDFYMKQRNFPESIRYHSQALDIFKVLNDREGLAGVNNGLGDVYENQGNYAEALKYYHIALASALDGNSKRAMEWPYFNIGEVYLYQGQYDSARTFFDHALIVQQELGHRGGEAWTYNDIGMTLARQHAYTEAEKYCSKGLEIATELNEPNGMRNAHKNLYTIYEETGDAARALEHYKAYMALSAAISNKENTAAITRLQMQHDFDQKQEIERISVREKDRRDMLGGLLIAIVVLGVVYFQRRDSRMKTALLQQQEQALQQKETLMKEIHHRVKNNLQITAVLLSMQLGEIHDEAAREMLRESILRLDAISLIHHQLNSTDMTGKVEFSQFATGLYNQLNKLFTKNDTHVTFYNHIPQIALDIDTAVPIGLILNELMTNSYKHAFASDNNTITLNLEKCNGLYTLSYKDSGPGLPTGQDHSGKTLGMTIIRMLSRQVGGDFKFQPGSSIFFVTFRDAAEMKKTA